MDCKCAGTSWRCGDRVVVLAPEIKSQYHTDDDGTSYTCAKAGRRGRGRLQVPLYWPCGGQKEEEKRKERKGVCARTEGWRMAGWMPVDAATAAAAAAAALRAVVEGMAILSMQGKPSFFLCISLPAPADASPPIACAPPKGRSPCLWLFPVVGLHFLLSSLVWLCRPFP
ncbi:hypothetical protein BDZ91DRAFT_263649 [Kalaharituber pfeilii]|nr:hypothetical protein BDZ91DRAFT_263649 [Kalaharituber pfeilii]